MQELIISEKRYEVIELPGRPKAILDRTVAEIYEVETRMINQAVDRNPEKFPGDFMFSLTLDEKELVTNCDRFNNIKHSSVMPRAFTWEGCNMLATILKSDVATQRAIQIVRGFTAMEKVMSGTTMDDDDAALMASARHVLEMTQHYVEVKREQKRLLAAQEQQWLEQAKQAMQIKQIEAKQDAILKRDGFYSVMAYANIRGLNITLSIAKDFGKLAVQLSKTLGIPTDKIADPRFGKVGLYHESVLEQIFRSRLA